jgi:hypothetical protein
VLPLVNHTALAWLWFASASLQGGTRMTRLWWIEGRSFPGMLGILNDGRYIRLDSGDPRGRPVQPRESTRW